MQDLPAVENQPLYNICCKIFPNSPFPFQLLRAKPVKMSSTVVSITFLDEEDFKNKIAAQEFIEYEEVYKGTLYGTLHTEIERIAKKNQHVIFDIDVVGALNIKKQFGDRALAIIVMPPSLEILSERLKNRATESKEKVAQRLAKASQELEMAQYFDHQLTNDTLQHSLEQANNLVRNFLHS